jgi:hypothetical protein
LPDEDQSKKTNFKEKLKQEKEDNISKFYHLIKTQPLKQFFEHEYDIVDLSWQTKIDIGGRI